jgi:hypothetical protein
MSAYRQSIYMTRAETTDKKVAAGAGSVVYPIRKIRSGKYSRRANGYLSLISRLRLSTDVFLSPAGLLFERLAFEFREGVTRTFGPAILTLDFDGGASVVHVDTRPVAMLMVGRRVGRQGPQA